MGAADSPTDGSINFSPHPRGLISEADRLSILLFIILLTPVARFVALQRMHADDL